VAGGSFFELCNWALRTSGQEDTKGLMASPARNRIAAVTVTAIAAAGAAVLAVAMFTAPTSCASNCGTNCPVNYVYIGDLDNAQLPIDQIIVNGPACPRQAAVYCVGDNNTTNCTHFIITGVAPGTCDVLVVFADRPAEIVHTQFGPAIQQGCCSGYTIVGDSVFVIPENPDAEITGLDGGTDAVTILVDGGAGDTGDTGVDGGTGDASGDDAAPGN
jgi:hypothetical protein